MANQTTNQTKKKASAKNKHVNFQNRDEMIALEAYLRAEKRGFVDGDPLDDWLDAESYIDEMLK